MRNAKRASALLLVTAVGLAAFGCRSRAAPSPSASASASARPKPTARPKSSAQPPRPAPIGCRVLGVKGDATGAPRVGQLLDGSSFFDLAKDTEVALRHSETTRELVLRGPGRFRACAKGEEFVAITRGKVRTTSGPGARAGAEVRLATPFGVVHFGDAALELDVSEKKADVTVAQGTASIDGRTEADGAPSPRSVSGPKGHVTFRGRSAPTLLVAECVKSAAAARASAAPAASAGTSANLGQWAVERLKSRQATRHACSRALASAGLDRSPEGDRLWDLAAAEIVATGSGGPAPGAPEK
jgi:hypothetical protein